MSRASLSHLVVVGRSSAGRPRTFRRNIDTAACATSQSAAYRRLTAVILGLDVASLADSLRAARTAAAPEGSAQRAA